ncbi:MAG: abortive infection protein [Bacilli bacterium]
MTNTDHIEKIINSNKGYITRKEINENGIPSFFLYDYVKKNNLIKYGTGFYARNDWIKDDYLVFQYLYPKYIFSFFSAAYLHGLGDYNPPFLEVTGPKNYRPFPLPKNGIITHTDTLKETYNIGIIEVETIFGNKIKVYDIEKTVCDFIKYRKKIDSESFVKCLNLYKKRIDKNVNNLMKYAKIMGIEDKVFSLMEVLLNED